LFGAIIPSERMEERAVKSTEFEVQYPMGSNHRTEADSVRTSIETTICTRRPERLGVARHTRKFDIELVFELASNGAVWTIEL
jgi:hypothetical protein